MKLQHCLCNKSKTLPDFCHILAQLWKFNSVILCISKHAAEWMFTFEDRCRHLPIQPMNPFVAAIGINTIENWQSNICGSLTYLLPRSSLSRLKEITRITSSMSNPFKNFSMTSLCTSQLQERVLLVGILWFDRRYKLSRLGHRKTGYSSHIHSHLAWRISASYFI